MTLPEGHGGVSTDTAPKVSYTALPLHVETPDPEFTPPQSRSSTPPIDNRRRGPYTKPRGPERIPLSTPDRIHSSTPLLRPKTPPSPPPSDTSMRIEVNLPEKTDHPPLPTALHANFITSCIGLATIAFLWIPVIILDLLGWESFRRPSVGVWGGLGVVSCTGAFYVSLLIESPADGVERRTDDTHRCMGTYDIFGSQSIGHWVGRYRRRVVVEECPGCPDFDRGGDDLCWVRGSVVGRRGIEVISGMHLSDVLDYEQASHSSIVRKQ